MYVKDLKPADQFVSAETRGTVYTALKVATAGPSTAVTYSTASGYIGYFVTPALAEVTKA